MQNAERPNIFDTMTNEDPRWHGWGYLNGRLDLLRADRDDLVAKGDAEVLAHAEAAGWSADDLFEWADSKNGRWFADDLTSRDDIHAKNSASLLRLPR